MAAAANRRCMAPSRSPRFQARNGPIGMASSSGTISGPKVEIEVGRADGDLVAGDGFQRQRIERADENGGASNGEQHVVEHERALAADGGEQAALLQGRRAPGVERQRAADQHDQDGEDEDAARADRRRRHAPR